MVVLCAGFAAYDVRLRENAMLGVALAAFAVVLFVTGSACRSGSGRGR